MTLQIHSLFYLLVGNLTRIDLFFPFAVKSSAEAPRRGIRTSCSWRWTNHGERSEQHCLVGRELQHHNNVAGKDRLQYQAQNYLNDCVNAVPGIPCYKYYNVIRVILLKMNESLFMKVKSIICRCVQWAFQSPLSVLVQTRSTDLAILYILYYITEYIIINRCFIVSRKAF